MARRKNPPPADFMLPPGSVWSMPELLLDVPEDGEARRWLRVHEDLRCAFRAAGDAPVRLGEVPS